MWASLLAWIQQPTTLQGIGLIIGAISHFSGLSTVESILTGALPLLLPDNSMKKTS